MNSIDRHSLANTFAVLLFLLLVYGLAANLECGGEQRAEKTRQETPSAVPCEPTAAPAARLVREPSCLAGKHKSQPAGADQRNPTDATERRT